MVSINDRSTRGKTRSGRLRMVDRWLVHSLESISPVELIVDVGPGEHAWTTLELVESLESIGCDARVVAIENDQRRCDNLRDEAGEAFAVVEGGFETDPGRPADFIRCMNVFRQYPVDDAVSGYAALASKLSEQGLLAVGTTDRAGDIGSFWEIDARGARRLFVFTTGARGFAPKQFRDFLPRDIRRNPAESNPFFDVLADWEAAWEATRTGTPEDDFFRSIEWLEQRGRAVLIAPGVARLAVDASRIF